jgi:pyridoxal phosphate enzyme (YggS family)
MAVRERIASACERSGRNPAEVTLVAVSKTHPAADVVAAFNAGVTDFGENRVQEGVAKFGEVARLLGGQYSGLVPHFVGHLQTNKVRAALGTFAILHAVDSERLLRAIDAAATSAVRVFIEVNVSGETTKFGVAPAGVGALLEAAQSLPRVRVEGLMTVAPLASDPEEVRPFFRALRELAGEHGLSSLSMGMTNDFEVAIEEGATHVRVGRAIFGERLS